MNVSSDGGEWSGVDPSAAIDALVANDLLDKLGFKREVMEERLRVEWTPEAAWADCECLSLYMCSLQLTLR